MQLGTDRSSSLSLVAISGLASHPFGSWQPKEDDKTFMWLRDALPGDVPGARIFLYGYDTLLHDSESFQSPIHLALSFIGHLKSSVWTTPTPKPVVFMAHSLGGIVLKEALILSWEKSMSCRHLFYGGIFFGVPSAGMETSHLLAMVQGQPNKDLIESLSPNSPYLSSLNDRFSGIIWSHHILCFWAYETKTSRTVEVSKDDYLL